MKLARKEARPMVRKMRKSGMSYDDIARTLNERGYVNQLGNRFTYSTVAAYFKRVKGKRRSVNVPRTTRGTRVVTKDPRLSVVEAIMKLDLNDSDKMAHIELLLNG